MSAYQHIDLILWFQSMHCKKGDLILTPAVSNYWFSEVIAIKLKEWNEVFVGCAGCLGDICCCMLAMPDWEPPSADGDRWGTLAKMEGKQGQLLDSDCNFRKFYSLV